VDEDGRALGLVGVIVDITERQAREVEAQHLQKLEALGRLSAGLAHEINTPIQFVGDNARFLAESYEAMLKLVLTYRRILDTSSGAISWYQRQELVQEAEAEADVDYLAEEVPTAVRQSLEGVERVASLVRAMKTFSHPGTSGQAPADLNEALRATMTVARNQIRYIADAVLDLGDVPPVVCNIADLNQVFLNMVVNAADAIQEKGDHGTITVVSRRDGDEVMITISDTGAGIPRDLQRRIFEPFFTTKKVGRGTGQGLALARAVICDQHGGTLTLTSEPGAGTTFTIRLPVVGRPGEAGEPA
jgi:signal transduction histidine kinase